MLFNCKYVCNNYCSYIITYIYHNVIIILMFIMCKFFRYVLNMHIAVNVVTVNESSKTDV